MEHLPHSFLQEVTPLSAWLRLHLESNHYYPIIIPLLSHYYPTIIPLLSHYYPTIIPLLSHYYPIFTKFVRIVFQPLSLIQWLNWLGRRSTEKTHGFLSTRTNGRNPSDLALTSQHPVRKDLEPLHLSHGFPWFSMLWLCRPWVRPEWPSKQKNWSRPQPGLSPFADL